MKKHVRKSFSIGLFFVLLTAVIVIWRTNPEAQTPSVPAFPGAEGFGAQTIGGRGGRVIEVTNLNNSGTGSLRDCITQSGARVCVFKVSGTINLTSGLVITNPNITIAGQTAPAGGITIKNADGNGSRALAISTSHVIVRYIRVRPGDGNTTSSSLDGIGIMAGSTNVIVDHVSTSWAVDGNFDIVGTQNTTVQWSIISDPTNGSHAEGSHAFDELITGDYFPVPSPGGVNIPLQGLSLHHNFYGTANERMPRIHSLGNTTTTPLDFRNNIVYNFRATPTNMSNDYGSVYSNFVNNYYKEGPNTPDPVPPQFRPLYPYAIRLGNPGAGISSAYVAGTYMIGKNGQPRTDVNACNDCAVRPGDEDRVVTTAYQAPSITQHAAIDLPAIVIPNVGATKPLRDSVDTAILANFTNQTGNGVPTLPLTWPNLNPSNLSGYTDTDRDGMPDTWETQYGFNPNSSNTGVGEGPQDQDNDGYTNLEEFLNETDPGTIAGPTTSPSVSPTSTPIAGTGVIQCDF